VQAASIVAVAGMLYLLFGRFVFGPDRGASR